jgi:hypothetical protein
MQFPKLFVSFLHDQLVVLVFFDGQLKGQFSQQQREQDDPESKNIAFGGIILLILCILAEMYLRSHISLSGSFVLVEGYSLPILLKPCRKSKIANFNTNLLILKAY